MKVRDLRGMEGPPGPPGVADGLTLSSGRLPLNSGVLYVDPYFQLLFTKVDATSGSIDYVVTGANFWGASAVISSVVSTQAGATVPTSEHHNKIVYQGVSVRLYAFSDLHTSRIMMTAASGVTSPVYEFLIVRTQTHIVWSARKYT